MSYRPDSDMRRVVVPAMTHTRRPLRRALCFVRQLERHVSRRVTGSATWSSVLETCAHGLAFTFKVAKQTTEFTDPAGNNEALIYARYHHLIIYSAVPGRAIVSMICWLHSRRQADTDATEPPK
jgi:hypothetical protein